MKFASIKSLALAATLIAAPALAQKMPDIGFKSVGRGAPLAASVIGMPEVGPNWIRQQGQQAAAKSARAWHQPPLEATSTTRPSRSKRTVSASSVLRPSRSAYSDSIGAPNSPVFRLSVRQLRARSR